MPCQTVWFPRLLLPASDCISFEQQAVYCWCLLAVTANVGFLVVQFPAASPGGMCIDFACVNRSLQESRLLHLMSEVTSHRKVRIPTAVDVLVSWGILQC